jgi:hypothetical protein
VHYADLARDPVGTVRGIYDSLGLEPGDGAFEAMSDHVAAHPRGEFGGHRYDVAAFGLTDAAVRERFAPYVERYGVQAEQLIKG